MVEPFYMSKVEDADQLMTGSNQTLGQVALSVYLTKLNAKMRSSQEMTAAADMPAVSQDVAVKAQTLAPSFGG